MVIMAACKCPRPKITISCNFRNLHKHVLDPTDVRFTTSVPAGYRIQDTALFCVVWILVFASRTVSPLMYHVHRMPIPEYAVSWAWCCWCSVKKAVSLHVLLCLCSELVLVTICTRRVDFRRRILFAPVMSVSTTDCLCWRSWFDPKFIFIMFMAFRSWRPDIHCNHGNHSWRRPVMAESSGRATL